MENPMVIFDRVKTDLSPKDFLQNYLRDIEPDQYKKTKLGDTITLTLPVKRNYIITYVGVKPEKFDVVGNELTIVMTECALFFVYTFLERKTNLFVSRMEVIDAL